MPLVYQQNINLTSRLGVWHIAEAEDFFIKEHIPLGRDISHPNKRLQHLAGRFLLKELFPGFPYQLIMIAETRKPFIQNESYHFSISHCKDYAAAIVSTSHQVGVDVEMFTTKVLKVKHKFLGMAEQELISQMAPDNSDYYIQLMTTAWSIKETLFKWYGDGELDFIDHLQIDAFNITGNTGKAHCKILKNAQIDLTVHFFYLNNNCIAWVLS
jgi:phosphopantetheinyl transferase